jgi:dihydropyrimidine dehydrogenase (NAD+) subunit PreA
MGTTRQDWTSLASRLSRAGADAIECSFSCPQGTLGSKPGFMLGQDPRLSETVTSWVKEGAGGTPVLVKITPQVADIAEIVEAVVRGGADGITASNTVPALLGVDLETFVPHPQVGTMSTYSGLSGPAIKPITLRVIAEIARHTGIPISGTGGASDWRDAAEFMLVGAANVQFCTAPMHYGFPLIEHLRDGLQRYLARKGFSSPSELVGRALKHLTDHARLPRGAKVRSSISRRLCLRDDLCYVACRDGGHAAITLGRSRLPSVDPDKCVGCGLCAAVCPAEGCIALTQIPPAARRSRSGRRGSRKHTTHGARG